MWHLRGCRDWKSRQLASHSFLENAADAPATGKSAKAAGKKSDKAKTAKVKAPKTKTAKASKTTASGKPGKKQKYRLVPQPSGVRRTRSDHPLHILYNQEPRNR